MTTELINLVENEGRCHPCWSPACTVVAIAAYVKAWMPVATEGGIPIAPFWDATVEVNHEKGLAWVCAAMTPEMAKRLRATVGWGAAEIESQLRTYLELYMPLGIVWWPQVVVAEKP